MASTSYHNSCTCGADQFYDALHRTGCAIEGQRTPSEEVSQSVPMRSFPRRTPEGPSIETLYIEDPMLAKGTPCFTCDEPAYTTFWTAIFDNPVRIPLCWACISHLLGLGLRTHCCEILKNEVMSPEEDAS